MLRFLSVFLLLCFASVAASAQIIGDTITVKKSFGGARFEHYGREISPKQVQELLQPVPEAFKEMKKARTNNTAANIFGGAGGFLIGYTLGTALGGGDPEWTLAAVGGGLVLASIPFSVKFRKQASRAVSLYNADKLQQQGMGSLQMQFGFTPSGLGLLLQL